IVTSNQTQPGKLPAQSEPNPRGEAKAIILRSGTEYEGPAMPPDQTTADTTRVPLTRPVSAPQEEGPTHSEPAPQEDTARTEPTRTVPTPSEEAEGKKKKGAEQPPPYRPPVPFPQRLAEARQNEQFAKFAKVLKQLHITIPFTEALTQMPTYAKFLNDILSNKRSLGGHETVKLTEQCSAILRNELPPKLDDPGKFSIPCTIGKATIKKALCDLGASVSLMPRPIYDRLGVGELKPTRIDRKSVV